ncbi:MAG: ankyrin repeat domain-containing protein, partial [Verrucomicrobiota bacterium]
MKKSMMNPQLLAMFLLVSPVMAETKETRFEKLVKEHAKRVERLEGFSRLGRPENSRLNDAVRGGDLDRVKKLLAEKTTIEPVDMLMAATQGHLEMIRLLARHGGDLSARLPQGRTPLYYAITGGHKDLAIWLIDEKATADDSQWKHTLLHVAIAHASVHPAAGEEIARRLIKSGADVN